MYKKQIDDYIKLGHGKSLSENTSLQNTQTKQTIYHTMLL